MTNDSQESNGWEKILSSKVLKQIGEGKLVDCDHKIIKGDLDLSQLPKVSVCKTKNIGGDGLSIELAVVRSTIKIKNSRIEGNVNFANAILMNNISFEGTQFEGMALFKGTLFREESNFARSIFKEYADFSGSSFNRDAAFGGSQFIGVTTIHTYTGTSPHITITGDIHLGSANFCESHFGNIALFDHSRFKSSVYFSKAKFNGQASFDETQFEGQTFFVPTVFKRRVDFNGTKFSFGVGFYGSRFKDDAYFIEAQLGGASFDRSQFSGDAHFERARFDSVGFGRSRFIGDILTFKDAIFKEAINQENACRRAKNVLERSGDRDGSGYHFYREMEAKRRQKGIRTNTGATPTSTHILLLSLVDALKNREWSKVLRFLRYNSIDYFFFQHLFGGYGEYPFWIIFWWLLIVGAFAFIYRSFHGIEGAACTWQCLYFSFLVAFTRGYGDYHPTPSFEWVVTTEIVIGLAMFGIFIAAITRRYMR